MIKKLFIFALGIVLLGLALYQGHHYILEKLGKLLTFDLFNVYIFNISACIFICAGVEFLNTKLPSQVGYAYLASVFVKIGLFVLVFKDVLLKEENFPMHERLSIVVPMMVFLLIEAVYCGKLMNQS